MEIHKLSKIPQNFTIPKRGNVGAVSNFWENEEDGQANYDRWESVLCHTSQVARIV